ncbi:MULTISPECIES: carbohydrate ABC transporter permease [Streptomyces]|jgi:multiple sugar transport system permease protein|uniref:Carbohydrate ABC transporter permease n=1 Tax=Streptomyces doudnae TaxID=3075536 RepID=A0ABD5EUT7_9ACTN|nr:MULTISPECIES: carbohydrate ABC transporter permease [unclassified Streptomyces]MDT0437379.1 carbohydrate ABC transporter permease [Streptomyces sp. DSM 41981]MYQ62975.1 ABC transporter permease subunit [Streptomyces sp. SID4950]SCD48170.1 multiple sugar transport system permease protein [Streptomyces sp. SolWspMP-5a-2]
MTSTTDLPARPAPARPRIRELSAPRRRPPTGRTHLSLGESRLARVLALGVLGVLAVVWLLPMSWALLTAFKSEQDASDPVHWLWPRHGLTLDGFRTVWERGDLPLWMFNSLLVSAAVTVITVLVSAMAGYAFSRTRFPGGRWLFTLTVAAVLVPPQMLIVPWFRQMLSLGLLDTYAAVILPQTVAPVMVFILKKHFDSLPRELEEAARIDGAGHARIFWSVLLPLSRPMLAAVAIFVFIGAWNNFLWPFVSTSDPALMTLPVGITSVKDAYGIQYAQSMASAVLAALPLVVVFLFFQRHIVKSVATTGLGGQ